MIAPDLDTLEWRTEPEGVGVHLVKTHMGVVNICQIAQGQDGLVIASGRGPLALGPYQRQGWQWAAVHMNIQNPAALDIYEALAGAQQDVDEAREVAAGFLERILTSDLSRKQKARLIGCSKKDLKTIEKGAEG